MDTANFLTQIRHAINMLTIWRDKLVYIKTVAV
jgi:hypothetical protein